MSLSSNYSTPTSELISSLGTFLVLPSLTLVTAAAIWSAGKALGGDVSAIQHAWQPVAPAFDMALNVNTLTEAGTLLAGTSALWGIASAATHEDIRDLGDKFRNFGAGMVDFAAKVGQSIGLVEEGQTATSTLANLPSNDGEHSYLRRAVCKFVQAAGVSAVAAGGLGIARVALDMPSLVANPGTSTLAIGAAAAVGVGGALYLLAREGLKPDQSKEGIDFQLMKPSKASVEVKKEPSYRVLAPGEY